MRKKKVRKVKTTKKLRRRVKKKVEKTRIKTGITALNKILEGGFLKGSAVLLIGPPRMGKSLFANHFVTADRGDVGVYVTTGDLGENIKKRLLAFRKDFKNLKVVDSYSSTTKRKVEGVIRVGKSNLSDISVALSEISKAYLPKLIRCVIDSVSNLILHNTVDDVANFLEDVISKFRERGDVLLLVVEKGMHDEHVYVMLEALSDSTIELEEKSDGNFLEISGFDVEAEKLLEFVPYHISSKGIQLK
jgi:KaiC/GvpD/RAD55 family RecA-like ATPase